MFIWIYTLTKTVIKPTEEEEKWGSMIIILRFFYIAVFAISGKGNNSVIYSSPGRSPGRAVVLPPASALAKVKVFYVEVFYVMGKALSGELSCPCDRSCLFSSHYS